MYNWFHKDPCRSLISVFIHVVVGTVHICKPSGIWLPTLTYHYCDYLWLSPCPCQAHTHIHFACVQYWNLWCRFCIVFQLYCATWEALICRQKIALVHTELSTPLPALPNTVWVRGWGSIKTESLATEMRGAPGMLQHAAEPRWVERSCPSLPREGSDIEGFGPGSSSYIFSSTWNVSWDPWSSEKQWKQMLE